EEDSHDRVPDRGAVPGELGPACCGSESDPGQQEEDDPDADADDRGDVPGHFRISGRSEVHRVLAAEAEPWGAGGLLLHPLVVLLPDALVGVRVAPHAPAWLRAKMYAAMARTCSGVKLPPPRGGMGAGN